MSDMNEQQQAISNVINYLHNACREWEHTEEEKSALERAMSDCSLEGRGCASAGHEAVKKAAESAFDALEAFGLQASEDNEVVGFFAVCSDLLEEGNQ